ncbi:MAG: hypothetical protein GY874_21705 [Desulfobacteraceae bacterium]|nr:hypothetical protein [Desulfobacteraceae bacterium]
MVHAKKFQFNTWRHFVVITPLELLFALSPLIVLSIPLIFICRRLAQNKGKDVTKYTLLSCIPLVNIYALLYLIGTPNKKSENKADQLLTNLEEKD